MPDSRDHQTYLSALVALDRSPEHAFELDWNLLGTGFGVDTVTATEATEELVRLAQEGELFLRDHALAALATVDVSGSMSARVASMVGSTSVSVSDEVLELWAERTRRSFETAFGGNGSNPHDVAERLFAPKSQIDVATQIRRGRAALKNSTFLRRFIVGATEADDHAIEPIDVDGYTAWTGTNEMGMVRAKYNLKSETLALPGRAERVAVHEDAHVIQGRVAKEYVDAGSVPVSAALTFLSSPVQPHLEGLADTIGYFDPGIRASLTPAAQYWNSAAILSNLLWMRVFEASLGGLECGPALETMNTLYPNAHFQPKRTAWLQVCLANPDKLAYQLSYGVGTHAYASAFEALSTTHSKQLVEATLGKPLVTGDLHQVVDLAIEQGQSFGRDE